MDFINANDSKTKRQISNSINILEKIFVDSSQLFSEMTKDEEIKLTMLAFCKVLIDVLEEMRLEIYSNKNFKINNYINQQKIIKQ